MRVLFTSIILLIGITNSSFAYWTQNNSNLLARFADSQLSFSLDIDQFKSALYQLQNNAEIIIDLPHVNGGINQYRVHKTSVLAAELALKYPDIQTYAINGVTNPAEYGRMELMDNVLSASIHSMSGQEIIQFSKNLSARGLPTYTVSAKTPQLKKSFSCSTEMRPNFSPNRLMQTGQKTQSRPVVGSLKKLKVAIAATAEYSAQFGTSKAEVLAEIAKAVNRVNGIYESELGLTLELVANNENIIFIGSDNFDNDDANTLIAQSQTQIDALIGTSNYDLGHVFSTGAGGLASVGSVCSASQKAQGVTGSSNPTGDAYWVDYVAHEMGHQLGADHTFNGSTGSCAGSSRTAAQAYEPGSGSTIMAYAGICGAENLQTNSDATFHTASIAQINTTMLGLSNCGQTISYSTIHNGVINNANPTVDAGADFSIPTSTPFMLTATASDSDADTIYYQWDSKDLGTATNSSTVGTDLGDNPLFKSNIPFTSNTRFFPSLHTLITTGSHISETTPTTARNINFAVKVTDGKNGFDTDDVKLTSVMPNVGAPGFFITSHGSAQNLQASSSTTLTWNVANSALAPINCTSLEVQQLHISSDNSSYCAETLATSLSNNGVANITVSSKSSAKSRFLLKCENNVFFSVNPANVSIVNGSTNADTSCLSTKGGVNIDTASIYNTGLSTSSGSSGGNSSSGGGLMNLPIIAGLSLLLLARRRV